MSTYTTAGKRKRHEHLFEGSYLRSHALQKKDFKHTLYILAKVVNRHGAVRSVRRQLDLWLSWESKIQRQVDDRTAVKGKCRH